MIKSIKNFVFKNKKTNNLYEKIFTYVLLIGISYIFLYPILKLVSVSFMSLQDILDPEVNWVSKNLSLRNFSVANRVIKLFPPSLYNEDLNFFQKIIGIFKDPGNLFKTFYNITIIAVVQTTIAALTGYAFAKYNFKFKNFWFAMVLISFVIPLPMVTMPRMNIISMIQDKIWMPFYDLVISGTFLENKIQRTLFNSLFPQVFFAIFGQGINSAILILIFYNFFKMIPRSLDEAARIDGASSFKVFYHIYLKLVVPIIIVVFLFSFIWNWNDGYSAEVFWNINNPLVISRLSIFDSEFSNMGSSLGEVNVNEGFKTAATLLTILPLMIIYIFAQKKFIEGIERTGITGE